jgi:hypothetical protein
VLDKVALGRDCVGQSGRGTGFVLGKVALGQDVLGKVALGRDFLRDLRVSPVSIISPLHNIVCHVGAGLRAISDSVVLFIHTSYDQLTPTAL